MEDKCALGPDCNLVLTGFMGTGKSCVAAGVAERLQRPLIDMDVEIARRAGMSIPEIFVQQGEAAFRQYERALCEELSTQQGLVIATGGGTLVDAQNRELLGRNGCIICLYCDADVLHHRLRECTDRPMLWSDDREQRLQDLLRARAPAYAAVPYHIDTTDRSIEQVIDAVLALFAHAPRTWSVRTPTGSYHVQLVPGGMAYLGALLRARDVAQRVVVVSDDHVWPLYGERLCATLRASRFSPVPLVVSAGEQHKTLETVRVLYDGFAEAELDRSGAVIALGGGVITDMAGFAAATYMRGVPLVQIPTTLLSMVDAGIGGKVAVDHPRGKNLIGAFVTPMLVILDPDTLATLPEVEYRAGLAEVIKAGIIADPALFEALEARRAPEVNGAALGVPPLRWLVERAIAVKIAIVEEDPYERGRRAILNLGHTFAHAFEVLADYTLHHGLAVSIGMAAAAHLAEARGLCTADTRRRIIATLERHDLPTRYDAHPPEAVYHAMRTDKKRRGASLRFILPRDIGDVVIETDVPAREVITALERIRR